MQCHTDRGREANRHTTACKGGREWVISYKVQSIRSINSWGWPVTLKQPCLLAKQGFNQAWKGPLVSPFSKLPGSTTAPAPQTHQLVLCSGSTLMWTGQQYYSMWKKRHVGITKSSELALCTSSWQPALQWESTLLANIPTQDQSACQKADETLTCDSTR